MRVFTKAHHGIKHGILGDKLSGVCNPGVIKQVTSTRPLSRVLDEASLDESNRGVTHATLSQEVEGRLIVEDRSVELFLCLAREWVLSGGKDEERQDTHCPSVDLQIVLYMSRIADHLRCHEVACTQGQLHRLMIVLIEYL